MDIVFLFNYIFEIFKFQKKSYVNNIDNRKKKLNIQLYN